MRQWLSHARAPRIRLPRTGASTSAFQTRARRTEFARDKAERLRVDPDAFESISSTVSPRALRSPASRAPKRPWLACRTSLRGACAARPSTTVAVISRSVVDDDDFGIIGPRRLHERCRKVLDLDGTRLPRCRTGLRWTAWATSPAHGLRGTHVEIGVDIDIVHDGRLTDLGSPFVSGSGPGSVRRRKTCRPSDSRPRSRSRRAGPRHR